MKVKEIKKWIKEHKEFVLGTASFVAGTTALIFFGAKLSKCGSRKTLGEILSNETWNSAGNASQVIDEDIFTYLAPTIEHAVLDDGKSYAFDRLYDLENGIHKLVSVNVLKVDDGQ